MKKILKNIIEFKDINIVLEGNLVKAVGPMGKYEFLVNKKINVVLEDKSIVLSHENDLCLLNTNTALVKNLIKGVTTKFKKKITLVGLGYEVKKISENELLFSLGFSHPKKLILPNLITAKIEGKNIIFLESLDKVLLGDYTKKIEKLRKYNSYNGKGAIVDGQKYIRKEVNKGAGK